MAASTVCTRQIFQFSRRKFGTNVSCFRKICCRAKSNKLYTIYTTGYAERQRVFNDAKTFQVFKGSEWSRVRAYSTEAEAQKEEEDYHSIITDKERSKGPSNKHEFQAETRKLLDIVAKSLYSEKEVFIREIISNASDALEKLRYLQVTSNEVSDKDIPLEIHIRTDESKKTFTIQDTGIGMTKEELIENLGTIARSGSKAFLSKEGDKPDLGSKIIGQFGVGFYSTFMVGDKVDVYSLASKPGSQAYKWSSDGLGSYELSEAEGVQRGTKIVVHLKGDCYDFSREEMVREIIKKYSNFVGVPIFINGKRVNVIEALWTMSPKDITPEMHEEFYRFISNTFDRPNYTMMYSTDAPLNIRALFYIPVQKPNMYEMSREIGSGGVSLYSKKIMILNKAESILPKWLRFLKGVVDSEDIPLNLSRELLQNNLLIIKLRDVLTRRVIKFLQDQAKKDKDKYLKFYNDYGFYFREAVVTSMEQSTKEDVAKLFRFESSAITAGEVTSLDEYVSRMKAGTREIYYLSAPSRELAESSPYFEAMKKQDKEVLFCYEPYDELVLMNLSQFDKKNLKSVENSMSDSKTDDNKVNADDPESLSQEQADALLLWLQGVLGNKLQKTKITKTIETYPAIVTVAEMGSARHFLRTTLADKSEEEKLRLLQPTLEINPSHPIMKKLNDLRSSDADLAKLVAFQVYDNAMIAAGLIDDPRTMLTRLNTLLTKTLEKVN